MHNAHRVYDDHCVLTERRKFEPTCVKSSRSMLGAGRPSIVIRRLTLVVRRWSSVVVRRSSSGARHPALVIRRSSSGARHPALVIRRSSSVAGHPSLVIHRSSSVPRHPSLVIRRSSSVGNALQGQAHFRESLPTTINRGAGSPQKGIFFGRDYAEALPLLKLNLHLQPYLSCL